VLEINARSILFIVALLFVIRPVTIALCSIGAKLSWREILLIGWIAPRGVVCAAMAGVLGPVLVEMGYKDGAQVMPVAFIIVVLSVIFHSLSIKPMAERLNLKTREANGLIITGVHSWGLQLAEILHGRGVPVLLVENKFASLSKARMMGLPTYYGELLSEEAEFQLDMIKYNSLLAATWSPAYNALVCDKFGHEFGRDRVLRVPPDIQEKTRRVSLSEHIRAGQWGNAAFSIEKLDQLYAEGWRFRTTRVGAKEVDGERRLIYPAENERCYLVGVLNKSGVRLRAEGITPSLKEDDYVLLFSLETPAA
jgi:hypothetical protein